MVCPKITGDGVVAKFLVMTSAGVAVPLLVMTQLTSSAACIVKLIGMVIRPETLVPVVLALVHTTLCA
jgi:hypothetical protein